MGCIGSDVDLPVTMYSSKSPIIFNISEKNKQKISKLIEKDDIMSLAVLMSEIGAQPNSQISDAKMKWMLTHLCCRWDADNCLQYLLKHYFCEHPVQYIDFVNAQTVEGYTCLHLCGLWRSQKCFYVLHHYGGLSLNARDKMMKSPYQTAVEYKCKKMVEVLQMYKDININFTQMQTAKLISGDVIAQDIGTQMKKKQKQADNMKNSTIKSTNNLLNNMTELQKQLMEQKAKLQKQKQQLLQQKLKKQLESDAQKARKLAEQAKKQGNQIADLQFQKRIKQQVDSILKMQQQKLNTELKNKENELIKVKDDLKRQQQQRIKKQKQQAQRKAEQYIKQQQEQINKKLVQKQQALDKLKKQQEERAKREKQESERRLKQIQQDYAKKQQQMNNNLKKKQEEIANLKRQSQQKLRKQLQNAQKSKQQALRKTQEQSMRTLRQKQQQIQKAKQLQEQKLRIQRQQAEKRALQLAYQHSKKINQTVNEVKKKQQQINQTVQNISKTANQLRQACKKFNNELPAQIQNAYLEALSLGVFQDKQFPANNKSIGDPSKANFANFTNNTVWLRPQQILKGDYKLFDGIDPNDIKQGSLGVCYMLATISVLAQNPKNIQKIFVFHDLKLGFYLLRFYVNGRPRFITVDDQIPCNKTTKSPLFTKPIGNQIWVLLIEKAWAKAIGDYLSAEAMTPDHMMEDLSAAPGFGSWFQKQATKSNSEHIKKLIQHEKLGHVIVVTSGQRKIQGIANNHAYSLLNVYQHNGRVIFKIRNPWGQFQWNGQYGQNSSLWTPQLKQKVKFEAKNDGVFFLSQNQLTQAYVYYSISLIQQKSFYSFTQFTSGRMQDLFFKIKVTKPGQFNLRVTQYFDRMLRDKSYKYSPLVFQVGKISQDKKSVKFISQGSQKSFFGAKSVHAFQTITSSFQAGQYFIRIKMLWTNPQKYNRAVLAAYGPELVNFQKLSNQQGTKYMKALFVSFSNSTARSTTGDGFFKIVTMKGQFVFIGQTQKEGKYKMTFKFNKAKMQMSQLDLGKINDSDIEIMVSKNEPGVGTAMRTQPAKGGTTGPVSIIAEKI